MSALEVGGSTGQVSRGRNIKQSDFFQTEKSISQVISISGRYETKNPLQAEERIWWLINESVVSFEIGGSTRQRLVAA